VLYLQHIRRIYSETSPLSHRIIGWSLDLTLVEQLNTDALQMAFIRRDIASGLIELKTRALAEPLIDTPKPYNNK